MVKHIILWKLKDTFSETEKQKIKSGIKEGLKSLKGKIPRLISVKVQTEHLYSSNADLMLDTSFEDEKALQGYSEHPEHLAVANSKVRPFTQVRLCLDYKE